MPENASAQAGPRVSASSQIVFDRYGNWGITLSGAAGGGLLSADASVILSLTGAPDINALAGPAIETGVSGELVGGVGIESIVGTGYGGLNITFGVGKSATIIEGHAELSNTDVLSHEKSKDYLTQVFAQRYQLPYSVSRVLVNALDISYRKLHDGIVHLENFGSDIFQYARELLTKGEGK